VLLDLATGDKLAEVEVPAQVFSVHDMWLAPAGQTAVLDADVPRFRGSQLLRRELLWLDARQPAAPVTAELAPNILNAAVSLDGVRLAALVVTPSPRGGRTPSLAAR
jgi:hypothetical protein